METIVSDSPDGFLVVISAPSGAGKTSVLHKVLRNHPDFVFSVSATTRPPREGERDGIDYHFISDEKFDSLMAEDEFLEWNTVHENRYGTLKSEVSAAIKDGKCMVLDTDIVGALNIKKIFSCAVLVFVLPPSPEELIRRLKERNTESPETVKKRFEAAPHEIAKMAECDYIIINDDLDTAVSRFEAIIKAESVRTCRMYPALKEWRKFIDGRNKQQA
jgi:guanylate kinase